MSESTEFVQDSTDEELQKIVLDNLMRKSLANLKRDICKLRSINSADARQAIKIIKTVIAVKRGQRPREH